MNLQELITRGRFLFAGAPERLAVFELVNGRRIAADIADVSGRSPNSVRNDLRVIASAELIQLRLDKDGQTVTREGSTIFEKVPLARTVPSRYFRGPIRRPQAERVKVVAPRASSERKPRLISLPNENETLDICRSGEDQLYEFKAAGTEARRITKEIAAMLHTPQGGLVIYGVSDDGTIEGSDLSRQTFDQSIQNSIQNAISPAPHTTVHSVQALGTEVLVARVPPWNKRDVYQYEGRVLIRKGTNVFIATPEESKKLHRGQQIL